LEDRIWYTGSESSSNHVWKPVDNSSAISVNLFDVGVDLLSGGRVLKGYLSLLVGIVGGEEKLSYNMVRCHFVGHV